MKLFKKNLINQHKKMNDFHSLYLKGIIKHGKMEVEHLQFITIRFKIHDGEPLLPEEQKIWEQWLRKTGQPETVEMSQEDEAVIAFVEENQMSEGAFLESLRQRKQQEEAAGTYSSQPVEDAGLSETITLPFKKNVITRKRIAIAAAGIGLLLTVCLTLYFNRTKWINITTGFGQIKEGVLPDGSRYWLQALSTLKYPENFSDNREVKINGEAYFEVVPDQMNPFEVVSGQQSVKVLGTAFNINSYKNDSVIRTSVQQGSVLVTAGNSQQVLRAGQQTTLKAGKLSLVPPDEITEALAWRKDSFFFKNMYITEIVAELERNYDVKMVFSSGVNDDKYTLSNFSRKDPITNILKMIESTNNVQFVLPNSPVKKGDVIIIRKIQ